jgi:uncharacterized protein
VKRTFEVGPGLACDIDRLVASRLLIQANSGGGKTRTLRRLLEQTHGKVQHLVIDPEGEYHTLREKFDYVLAAPKGGDTVAHPRTAKLLTERLLQLGVSAILDIYELNPDERQRFVKMFLQALVDAPRDLWHPALVVLDEAHVYAPEGKESESTSAVKAMASRGRKRGFCLVPATQRLAKLSKDVAAECNNKLVGRCTLDVDIKRAAEELGFTTNEQRQALRQLEPGQFYAFGPAFGVAAPQIVKVGGIKTTHPEPGQQAAPVPPPTEKVRKVLQQLADLPAEADAREKSLVELRKENADLKRQVAQATKATKPEASPVLSTKVVEKKVIGPKEAAALERTARHLEALIGKLDAALEKTTAIGRTAVAINDTGKQLLEHARTTIAGIRAALRPAPAHPVPARQIVPAINHRLTSRERPSRPSARPPSDTLSSGPGDASVGKSGLRRMLIALAQRPQGLTRRQLGLRARVSAKGGSFDTYLSKARVNGWVISEGERVVITDAGITALGSYEPLPEGEALLQHYLNEFGSSGAARMLRALADTYPNTLSRAELSEASGVSAAGGSFDTYLSRLRTLELVDGDRNGLRASDELFITT